MHRTLRPGHAALARLRTLALIALLLSALPLVAPAARVAHAAVDGFDLGTGRDGPLSVSTPDTIVNIYTTVTAPLAPGDIQIGVMSSAGIAAGDLLMVLQTTGIVPVPASGSSATLDLSAGPVGRWELARVASASGTTINLTASLFNSYAASVTQVIRVPEYTSVTISSAGSITARAWDRNTGGVIAFLVSGALNNDGIIQADALGFRGGSYVADLSGATGCTDLDEPAPTGGQKGEGIAVTRFGATSTGRGNVASGAGGGDCFLSGGGGGGNGGAGGQGGLTSPTDGGRNAGGMGGASLSYSPLDRLILGGGGGAGHSRSYAGGSGGAGGGGILIRADQLAGSGSISAAGGAAGDAFAQVGGNGGGAGGSISVRVAGSAGCGGISAPGGRGANIQTLQGYAPGGGGGGGRVLLQATSSACALSASGGNAGALADSSTWGAQAGQSGGVTQLRTPAAPSITTPADGSATNNQRPMLAGSADANATIVLYVDGSEVGRPTSDAGGGFTFQVGFDLAPGSHQAQAVALDQGAQSLPGAATAFTVDLSAPPAPVVLAPAAEAAIYMLVFTGTTEIGSSVTLLIDGATSLTVSADGAGNWRAQLPESAIAASPHQAMAFATDRAGNQGPNSEPVDFTYTPAVFPSFSSVEPPAATYGALYQHEFSLGGVPTPTLSVSQGSLPPGLALDGTILSGIPTAAGSYGPITVAASNGYGTDATQTFTLTVDQATVLVTPDDLAREYGLPNPNFSAQYDGFVNGDDFATAVTGAPDCTSPATPASAVGYYSISCEEGSLSAANYRFSISATGTLEILPAPLTITADDQTRRVGEANPPLTLSYGGLVNGDTPATVVSASPTCATSADEVSPPGSYPIVCSGGALATANYQLALQDGTLTITSAPAVGGIRYVRAGATGRNDGTSWANAYTRLQSALAAADSGDEIWVAAGRYTPSASGDRAASFALKSGVAVYGGFAGTETLRSQRSWQTNVTTLSGDIGAGGDASDNSYHVVTAEDAGALDGFTISGGNADGVAGQGDGGGINLSSASPILSNLIVTGNSGGEGGGLYAARSSAALANIMFSDNRATELGGGAFILDSSMTLDAVSFMGNSSAKDGGAIHNATSTLTMTGGVIAANMAERNGGGVNNVYTGKLTLAGVTISGNTSKSNGAGIYNGAAGSAAISDCTISGNASQFSGGGVGNTSNATMTISGSTISGNSAITGGGIASSGQLTVASSAIRDNSGAFAGGIRNGGKLTLANSTLDGNTATGGGGGVDSGGVLTITGSLFRDNISSNGSTSGSGGGLQVSQGTSLITNTTFSGNQAGGSKDDGGGAIMAYQGVLKLTNVTVAGNSTASDGSSGNGGGGISIASGVSITLTNTIVAGNTSAAGRPDISGTVASASHTLIGDMTGSGGITQGVHGVLAGSAASRLDPKLAALADNGGPTHTRALLSGSPAIDTADAAACPAADQRGYTRVAPCDIGAYELGAIAPRRYTVALPLVRR